jgi:hypothetical protein
MQPSRSSLGDHRLAHCGPAHPRIPMVIACIQLVRAMLLAHMLMRARAGIAVAMAITSTACTAGRGGSAEPAGVDASGGPAEPAGVDASGGGRCDRLRRGGLLGSGWTVSTLCRSTMRSYRVSRLWAWGEVLSRRLQARSGRPCHSRFELRPDVRQRQGLHRHLRGQHVQRMQLQLHQRRNKCQGTAAVQLRHGNPLSRCVRAVPQ